MRSHLAWSAALVLVLGAATVVAQEAQPPVPPKPDSPYIGAAACKPCHEAVYEKWSKSGHQRSFERLGSEDRLKPDCLACHVTGAADVVAAQLDKPSLPGVQCESCHGPARPHAEQAAASPPATKGLTRKPGEALCLRCHNIKSPHFRGFFYGAMVGMVHGKNKFDPGP
jgi:hypothetical protein